MRKDTEPYQLDEPPGVELHCLYGTGVKTPESFRYSTAASFPDSQPEYIYGDGDGSVNVRSLRAPKHWIKNQTHPIYFKELPGIEHNDMLKHPTVISYILQLLNT